MKRSISIRLKAAFLLIVFSLSTIVGFACSVGLNTTLNAEHHKEPDGHQPNSHDHGKGHVHAASTNHHQNPVKDHAHPADHHLGQADHPKQDSNASKNAEDNCCKDEVAKFEKSEKRAPQSSNYNLQPSFVTLAFNTPFTLDARASHIFLHSNRHFVRNHHPPIADIRIAIRSFLI